MATMAGDAPYEERSLFVRKATGLVRGWSVHDAFIYATFSINLITLGLYIFADGPFIPKGSLLLAIILSGAYLCFQTIVYAALIAVMPRAGGDYVWVSRVIGGGIGFVLAVCGWWFINWHWVPIYANILIKEFFQPLGAVLGWDGFVSFWGEAKGVFWASVITAVLAAIFISLGMRGYAKLQKICFYSGMAGLLIIFGLLIFHSKSDFHSAFNHYAHSTYGSTSTDAYSATIKDGTYSGASSLGGLAFGSTILLVPMIAFFNLWSNWGATLYGEVRGASDFRKNIYAMAGALVFTTILAIIFLLLIAHTMGWNFYNSANNAWWAGKDQMGGVWPYPVTLATFFVSPWLQFIVILLMSLWFFGWVGTVFLTASRVIFATAFDRILPEWAARVDRRGTPYFAILIMLGPSLVIAYFYAYNSKFTSWTLDATLVIAVTFVGSTVAAGLLPYRKPEIYNASPIAKYKVAGLPLITAAAILFLAYLGFCIYKWLQDGVYGSNNHDSLLYMGCLYAVALLIYVGSRIVRKRQGMDLGMVYNEIPSE
ncbi:MAG TPA: APC family permease [Gaiellaceae bacterium]|jgi:APA family basic amino acid/polyamine antiporter|nr:APC family permease [Gaiellaceae bacterium]